MKKVITALCLAAVAISPAWAAKIAVFGDNANLLSYVSGSNTVQVVSDAQLLDANFLTANSFDTFIYVYDDQGNLLTPNLSPTAASTVNSFVTGNIALFTSDLTDTNFPGDASNTLMDNALSFAGNRGFIGILTGACAAMTSNSVGLQAIGLLDGSCTRVGLGPGGDALRIVQPGSPIANGVDLSSDLGEAHQFFATITLNDESLIVARNTIAGAPGIPSVIGFERRTAAVDEPSALALFGFGLVVAAFARRRRQPGEA